MVYHYETGRLGMRHRGSSNPALLGGTGESYLVDDYIKMDQIAARIAELEARQQELIQEERKVLKELISLDGQAHELMRQMRERQHEIDSQG